MGGRKAIDKAFPDPSRRVGIDEDDWDGDPDDRPLTETEKVPFEPGEEDDWMRDFKASLPAAS